MSLSQKLRVVIFENLNFEPVISNILFSFVFIWIAKALRMVPRKDEEFSIKGGRGRGVRPYWNENVTSDQLGRMGFQIRSTRAYAACNRNLGLALSIFDKRVKIL